MNNAGSFTNQQLYSVLIPNSKFQKIFSKRSAQLSISDFFRYFPSCSFNYRSPQTSLPRRCSHGPERELHQDSDHNASPAFNLRPKHPTVCQFSSPPLNTHLESLHTRRGLRVPQPDRPVRAPARDGPPVWRDGHAQDKASVPLKMLGKSRIRALEWKQCPTLHPIPRACGGTPPPPNPKS